MDRFPLLYTVLVLCFIWETSGRNVMSMASSHPVSTYNISCGDISCDGRYFYCNEGFEPPECLLCSDTCSYYRIGNVLHLHMYCNKICWAYMRKTYGPSDVPKIGTLNIKTKTKWENKEVAVIIAVLVISCVIALILGVFLYKAKKTISEMKSAIQPGLPPTTVHFPGSGNRSPRASIIDLHRSANYMTGRRHDDQATSTPLLPHCEDVQSESHAEPVSIAQPCSSLHDIDQEGLLSTVSRTLSLQPKISSDESDDPRTIPKEVDRRTPDRTSSGMSRSSSSGIELNLTAHGSRDDIFVYNNGHSTGSYPHQAQPHTSESKHDADLIRNKRHAQSSIPVAEGGKMVTHAGISRNDSGVSTTHSIN